ncbi:hypothetical protein OU787_26760 [Kitasatospora sp. YST-16]|uniref:hypothetical protein n=1 Tax=Kitasatospora sp. YST-16 TaxID=2998080 RepID=UPI0022837257|nr:hypothetical protein [Kitasatospora sp. YST-16]WAL74787.1 hypothetical protein OU787_26760 [Kitasatospora sp. YST-16]WNW40841.1 hypothetical protein RKE32_26695 [Streptomyces sp. Li-HN-5-13]
MFGRIFSRMFGGMFGGRLGPSEKLNDLVAQLRPDLSRESLGVGPDFPGVVPNPLLSSEARKRSAELRTGELAFGVLVDWREVSSDGSPRVVLMLDVETADGSSFRGIADEDLTITELTRLAPGQTMPVRYRPAVMDHCVALARDAGAPGPGR